MLALAAGYYAGRYARGLDGHRADSLDPLSSAPVASSVELPRDPSPVPGNLDAPLPETAEALVQETAAAIAYLINSFPGDADALEMRARQHEWRGETSKAIEVWQRCLEINPRYVHAYVGMASAETERGDHARAAELADKAIQLDPRNFQARAIRADSLLQLGRADEVPAVLEEYLKSDPRSRGHFLLAQACSQTGDYEKARDHYQAAIRLYPDYVQAYHGLAVAYERLGDPEKAERAMEKFRELGSPQEAAARIRGAKISDLELLYRGAAVLLTDAGRVLYVRGETDVAEAYWLRAAALDETNVACRQSLAFLCRNAGRQGETIAWLTQLAALEPNNSSYWVEIGRTYEELGMLPSAEESFRKACDAEPHSAAGYAALADLLLRYEQNLPETLELTRKAVEHDPSAPNYAMLSAAQRLNGELDQALSAIERAIELAPQSPSYRAVRDAITAEQRK